MTWYSDAYIFLPRFIGSNILVKEHSRFMTCIFIGHIISVIGSEV